MKGSTHPACDRQNYCTGISTSFRNVCQCIEQLVFLFQYSIQNPWSFAHQAKEEENQSELKTFFCLYMHYNKISVTIFFCHFNDRILPPINKIPVASFQVLVENSGLIHASVVMVQPSH
jgi:hypothetical protein